MITLQRAEIGISSDIILNVGSEAQTLSSYAEEISVFLSENVLNAIKIDPALASSIENTYISVGEGVVEDCSGNPASAAIVQVANFTGDYTPPELLHFNLDLDEGILIAFFSEAIDVLTISFTEITLQNTASSAVSPTHFYTLTGGTVLSPNDNEVTISLASEDLMFLQTSLDIASGRETTFLSFTSLATGDTSGNLVVSITTENAIRVTSFSPDSPDLFLSENPGATYVMISWSVPIGPAIFYYTVAWERETTPECPDSHIGRKVLSSEQTNITLSGLEEGSRYSVSSHCN